MAQPKKEKEKRTFFCILFYYYYFIFFFCLEEKENEEKKNRGGSNGRWCWANLPVGIGGPADANQKIDVESDAAHSLPRRWRRYSSEWVPLFCNEIVSIFFFVSQMFMADQIIIPKYPTS